MSYRHKRSNRDHRISETDTSDTSTDMDCWYARNLSQERGRKRRRTRLCKFCGKTITKSKSVPPPIPPFLKSTGRKQLLLRGDVLRTCKSKQQARFSESLKELELRNRKRRINTMKINDPSRSIFNVTNTRMYRTHLEIARSKEGPSLMIQRSEGNITDRPYAEDEPKKRKKSDDSDTDERTDTNGDSDHDGDDEGEDEDDRNKNNNNPTLKMGGANRSKNVFR